MRPAYDEVSVESLAALGRIQKPIKRRSLPDLIDRMFADHLSLHEAKLVLSKLKVVK